MHTSFNTMAGEPPGRQVQQQRSPVDAKFVTGGSCSFVITDKSRTTVGQICSLSSVILFITQHSNLIMLSIPCYLMMVNVYWLFYLKLSSAKFNQFWGTFLAGLLLPLGLVLWTSVCLFLPRWLKPFRYLVILDSPEMVCLTSSLVCSEIDPQMA